MVMGPCGGVRPDGRCEVIDEPCVFPEPAVWPEPDQVPVVPLPPPLDRLPGPLILTDFTAEPFSVPALRTVAATLIPTCDAVLVGEHQNRPDFPPTLLATLLREAGARPWITLACRDRNRIVLEQELTGLRHLGVDVVLCVTGDARGYDVRPDVTQVFDLDGPRLAALAARVGLSAAVPETPPRRPGPGGPPGCCRSSGPARRWPCSTTPPPAPCRSFMAAAIEAGVTIPVIAAVAVYTDPRVGHRAQRPARPGTGPGRGAARAGRPGPGRGRHGRRRGRSRELLAIPGVVGVNLSGLASSRGYEYAAGVKADCATRIRAVAGHDQP